MSLARRAIRGSVALTAGTWFVQILNLALQLVVARLLGPTAFGLYAFCFAINELISIVGAFSMQHALVQAREESQARYDTAIAISGGLGLVGVLLAAAIAPVLGSVRSPEAAAFLLVMASASALRFLAQIPQAHLERALRYGPITRIAIASALWPNVAAVALAWLGLGAWSLVLRDALFAATFLVLSLVVSGYRFRARLERGAWRSLMDFGRPMFLSRGVETLIERLDSLAVGAFLGNRAVGVYHWGRTLAELGSVATRPLERVSLNVYSRLQDDTGRLSRAFTLGNTVLVRVLLAGSATLLVFPAETLRLLLGPEWVDAAPVLRWLGLYGALVPLLNHAKALYYGLGQVRRMLRIQGVQLLCFAGGVGVASLLGRTDVMAASLLLTTAVALLLTWALGRDLVDFSPVRLVRLPLALLTATAVGLLGLESAGTLAVLPWWTLPFLAPLVYSAMLLLFEGAKLREEARYLIDQARDDAP